MWIYIWYIYIYIFTKICILVFYYLCFILTTFLLAAAVYKHDNWPFYGLMNHQNMKCWLIFVCVCVRSCLCVLVQSFAITIGGDLLSVVYDGYKCVYVFILILYVYLFIFFFL